MPFSLHDRVMVDSSNVRQDQVPQREVEQRVYSSSVSGINTTTSSASSSLGSSGIDWACCGGFVVWAFCQWWDWTLGCLELWWHILTASHMSDISLFRLSNIMLGWHYIGVMLSTLWAREVEILSRTPSYPAFLLVTVPDAWWLWALPLITGCIALLVAVPYMIRIPGAFHQGAVITALISLFVLEAMLPVGLLVCTTLCLLQKVTWLSGLLILGMVWISVTLCAHWVRCLVYQSIGRG